MGGGWRPGAGWDIGRIFMAPAVSILVAGLALGYERPRYRQPPEALPGDVVASR